MPFDEIGLGSGYRTRFTHSDWRPLGLRGAPPVREVEATSALPHETLSANETSNASGVIVVVTIVE